MSSALNDSHIFEVFPFLQSVPHAEWTAAQPKVLIYPAHARVFQKNEAANYAVLLLRGTMRITLIGEDGSESLLTLLSAGEVCSLMVLCGLSGRDYPGSLTAETEVEVLLVSKSSFLSWVQMQPAIRNAIFGGLLDGIVRTSQMLQAKYNEPLEARLAKALLRATSSANPILHITHQMLANEIGSAREVVSRVLKRYQSKGWVETGRGWVQIIDRGRLEAQLGD
ncbi:Crp/Fnr family transcriptional regulator [Paenibacillus sp. OAS669]|uniref:Crp/Fnr family transcriptional regulator n=1 Tax=Paenibacillus sp. OAS669 TaxID=2663821 RepID=UPI00178A9242|nr:Crp/Fnr family transcriptional regulator [Paenibacillus sp. OAS669]MBE1441241.1 CRP/FNR family transcriptional regulator [Paenibacillus sp. OAS669]